MAHSAIIASKNVKLLSSRHGLRRRQHLLAGCLATSAAAGLFGARIVPSAAAGVNVITPDGRTLTSVQTAGHTTTITTGTISGGDAFNSFNNFQVGNGNTVNMIVPTSANYLINLVHDGPVEINGVLNSYKNGQIGGNIVFADPRGVLVGSSGVLNVGSVAFTAPNAQFLNQLMNEAGKVDLAAAGELISGAAPLSAHGLISIEGRINALQSLNLSAAEVIAAKSSVLTAGDSARLQNALFQATVNTTGLKRGAAIAESNGTIAIVGTDQVNLAGNIHAGGAKGGNIAVTAANISVKSGAKIDASGTNGGGTVAIGGDAHGAGPLADAQTLTVARGARISANAVLRGDGGTLTLWSNQGTHFAGIVSARGGAAIGNGGSVEISSPSNLVVTGTVDTSAPHGLMGTLLLDPTDLYVINGASGSGTEDSSVSAGSLSSSAANGSPASTISVGEIQSLGDTNITLAASDAITIGDSSGNAADINLSTDTHPLATGSLTLEAGTGTGAGNISFNTGSSIETAGGAVVLDAGSGFTGAASTSGGVATLGNISTLGGKLTVNAASAVTLPSGVTINTQTAAANAATAGAVDFEVSQSQSIGVGQATANTGVTISGTLKGGDITLHASGSASVSYDSSVTAIATTTATILGGSLLGDAFLYVYGDGAATVELTGTSNVSGNNLSLYSQTTTVAKNAHYDANLLGNPVALDAMYGAVKGTAKSLIDTGAHVSVGGDLQLVANNNDTLDISTEVLNTSTNSSNFLALAAAWGESSIHSTADVAGGANVTLAQGSNVVIAAQNTNSFSIGATAQADNQSKAGVAAAISDLTTSAIATDGANLGSTAAKVGNVTILATDTTTLEHTSASTSTGSGLAAKVETALASGASGALSTLGTKMSSFLGSTSGQSSGSGTDQSSANGTASSSTSIPFRIGSALALSLVNQTATADVAAEDSIAAPVIVSGGNVAILSGMMVAGVNNVADSGVTSSTTQGTSTNPSSNTSVSIGVAVGLYTRTNDAFVGDGASVTGVNVGIKADTNDPASTTWATWDGLSSITSKLNSNLGLVDDVLTSFASATSSSSNLSLAGAVDWFNVANTTKSYIGVGATVDSTATSESAPTTGSLSGILWQTILPGSTNATLPTIVDLTDWTNPVSVLSSDFTSSLNIAGNVSFTSLGLSSGTNGTAVGGSFSGFFYGNNTYAAIGSGSKVSSANATDGVDVSAIGVDQALTLASTSGQTNSVAANGIFTMVDVENTTQASISNAADISAAAVTLHGEEDMSLWAASGAVSLATTQGSAAVGLSVSLDYTSTETDAFIGDNSSLLGGTGSGGGYVHTNTLDVTAVSNGQSAAMALAVAAVSNSNPDSTSEPGALSKAMTKFKNFTNSIKTKASGIVSNIPLISSLATEIAPSASSTAAASNPSFGLAISGDSAATVSYINTHAYIDHGTIAGFNGTSVTPTVEALNYTGLISVTGGASITYAKNPSSSFTAAISGSVAFNEISNNTTAYIDDQSDLTNAQNVTVQALSGGFEVSVALGIAATAGSTDNSGGGALCLSLPIANSTTSAYIQDSTLDGGTGTSRGVKVTAYDSTLIGSGGGAGYGGGEGGVGVVFTIVPVTNTISAYLAGDTLTDYDTLDVNALDASQIISGGVEVGVVPSGFAINGSFVFNYIGNTTTAYITSYAPSGGPVVGTSVTTTGEVTVNASSDTPTATYNSLLTSATQGSQTDSNINLYQNFGQKTLPFGQQNEILAVTGMVGVGEDAVGIGLAGNIIDSGYTAYIADATVNAGGLVTVSSKNNSTIIGVSVGLSVGTDGVGLDGSLTGNYIGENGGVGSTATIGNSNDTGVTATSVTGDGVNVTAQNSSSIYADAGALGFSSTTALGAAVGYNQSNDTADASVTQATVNAGTTGTLQIQGQNSALIAANAVAGGAGTNVSIDGSVTVNVITDHTTAQADNSTLTAGYLDLTATEPTASIYDLAGAVAGSTSGSGIGFSIGISDINNVLNADLVGVTSNAGYQTQIQATSGGYIGNIAFAGAASSEVSVGFANASSNIGNTVNAYIQDSGQTETANKTSISATDTSTIKSLSAGIAAGGTAAASIATTISRISNSLNAYMTGASTGTQPDWIALDATLDASSNATIQSLAAGFGAGGEGAGAGSIAINILTNTVNSYIDGGQQLTAMDNVGVTALNQNAIQDIAGALAIAPTNFGGGLSTAVNYIGGGTYAYISGPGTNVNALAANSADSLTYSTGALSQDPTQGSLTDFNNFATNFQNNGAPSLSESTATLTGLSVNAQTLNSLTQLAFTGAFAFDPLGSAAVSATIDVNVMNGTTNAYIDQAAINQTPSYTPSGGSTINAGAGQQVNVTASAHEYGGDLVLGVAGGPTDAAVTATIAVNYFGNTTDAYITNSNTSANQAINVQANGTQDAVGLGAGVSGAAVGAAGTLVTNVFHSDTEAYAYGETLDTTNLTINAVGRDTATMGSVALGVGGFGAAGSFLIDISTDTTKAYLGNPTATTTATISGGLNVTANTTTNLNALNASAGVGAGAGIAGMLTVADIGDTTTADVYSTNMDQNSGDPKASYVNVAATDNLNINSYAGALAASETGAGIGASINVVALTSQVGAGVAGSNMTTSGSFNVTATENNNTQLVTATAGLGGAVGLAGSAGVLLVDGGNPSASGGYQTNAQSNASSSISGANSEMNQSLLGNVSSSDLTDANGNSEVNTINSSTEQSLSLFNSSPNGTVATISGGTINAGSVNVAAQYNVATQNIAGAAGIGGVAGFGTALAITSLSGQATANIDGGAIINTTAGQSYTDSNGQSQTSTGDVTVSAAETPYNNQKTMETDAYAGGGSLFLAGSASVAYGNDNSGVNATIGDNSKITVNGVPANPTNGNGAVQVVATADPTVLAKSFGVDASVGVSVGAAVSVASLTETVQAQLGNHVTISTPGTFTVAATLQPLSIGGVAQNSVETDATAGTGGLLAGADGADSSSSITANLTASTGSYDSLPSGAVNIQASNTSNQLASATGVAVGGLLAVGETVSLASSGGTTTAYLGKDNSTAANNTGSLQLTATSNVGNTADATAGSGGAIAGNGAYAHTNDTTVTNAEMAAQTYTAPTSSQAAQFGLTFLTADVSATHTSTFTSNADTINAAAVGASGANSTNDVSANTTVNFDQGASLFATGSLTAEAANKTFEGSGGYSAQGGSGGVLIGTAVISNITVNNFATVNLLGNNMLSTGLDPFLVPGVIVMTADSSDNINDQSTIETGGVIDGAGINANTQVTENNAVNIDSGSTLASFGNIEIGTYTASDVAAGGLVHTYGAAGTGTANVTTNVTANQNVTIQGSTTILGYGNVYITAGEAQGGQFTSRTNPVALGESYVRGLIAIPTQSATATANDQTSVTINSGATVESGGNMFVGGFEGSQNPQAQGAGHGYELGFIPATDSNNNASSPGTENVTIAGTLLAGAFNQQNVTINSSGVQVTGPELAVSTTTGYNFAAYLSMLQTQGADPSIISMLQNNTATGPVTMVELGELFASAGNVNINATQLLGSGSVTANGNASITVNNSTPDYLFMTSAYISPISGGNINFTGAATEASDGSLGVHGNNPGAQPQISITSSYDPATGPGPAIILEPNSTLTSLTGLVNITDSFGSVGQFGTINAEEVIISVPNGFYGVSKPGQYYSTGGAPDAVWFSQLGLPSTATAAVDRVINVLYNSGGGNTDQSLTESLLYNNNFTFTNSSGSYDGFSPEIFYGSMYPYFYSYSAADNTGFGPLQPNVFAMNNGGQYRPQYFTPLVQALTQPANFTSYPSGITAGPTTDSAINAAQVGISAQYVDINSKINAGHPTDWSANLGTSVQTEITNAQNAYNQGTFSIFGYTFHFAPSVVSLSSLPTVQTGDQAISATYNVLSNQITLQNDINASGGGFVYLNGGILSSLPSSQINVDTGFGSVTINNQTSASLLVNNIETGNGAVGEVKIVDTLQQSNNGSPLRTWYLYHSNTGELDTFNNQSNNASTLAGAVQIGKVFSATSNYAPQSGVAIQWSETATASRSITPVYDSKGNEINLTASHWAFNAVSGQPGNPWVLGSYTVTNVGANGPVLQQSYSGYVSNSHNDGYVTFTYADNNFTPPTGNPYGSNYYFDPIYPTAISLTDTITARADNPIGISFSGGSASQITIDSIHDVTLAGMINNPTGPMTLSATSGAITQSLGDQIVTNGLNIQAGTGIGSSAAPIVVDLTGGSLTAQTTAGDVYVTAQSGVTIGTISAGTSGNYGDVNITANQDIAALAGSGTVTGDNITLTSIAGGVGTAANPVTVNGVGTVEAGGVTNGGQITVNAVGDIFLTAPDNLIVNQIDSQAGNVTLNIGGTVYDYRAQTPVEALSTTQLTQIDTALDLTDSSSNATTTHSVVPYLQSVYANYNTYWKLLANGTVDSNGNFTLSTQGATVYTPISQVALTPNSNGTAYIHYASVQAYAQALYNSSVNFFKSNLGTNWQQTVGTTFNPAFTYSVPTSATAGITTVADLTSNAYWTTGQLQQAINLNALQSSSTGGAVGNATPNISGRNVVVTANGVGTLALPVTFSQSVLENGDLSTTDAAALALANTPGDVTIAGDPTLGNATITVKQTAPVFLTVNGTFSGNAGSGPLFVQSNGSLTLQNVSAGGDIRITAADSVFGSGTGNPDITTTNGGLTLLAGTGSIGSVTTPVDFQITGTLVTEAGISTYLTTGDSSVTLGGVASGNTFQLYAPSASIMGDSTFSGTNIIAPIISLSAGSGGIGSSSSSLTLDNSVPSTSAIVPAATITSGGGVYLFDPNISGLLTLGTVGAQGPVNIVAADSLIASSVTTQSGDITLASSGGNNTVQTVQTLNGALTLTSVGSLTVGNGSATGEASLTATGGNITIGQVASSLSSGLAINVNAFGSISGSTTNIGQTNLLDALATGTQTMTLQAGTGIGTSSQYLVADVPELTANTNSGDIYIHNLEGLNAPSITAPEGSIGLLVDGSLTFGTFNAHHDLSVTANGNITGSSFTAGGNGTLISNTGIVTVPNISVGGNFTLDSSGNIDIQSLSSGGIISLLSRDGDVNIQTLVANGGYIGAGPGTTPANAPFPSSPGDVFLPNATITSSLAVYANRIEGHLIQPQPASAPLLLDIRGSGGGSALAAAVILTIDPEAVTFSNLQAQYAQITTGADNVIINQGDIVGTLSLITPLTNLFMNNQNVILVPTDIQLYQPGGLFGFSLTGTDLVTNTFVERFATGYSVSVSNYVGGHNDSGFNYGGASALRDSQRFSSDSQTLEDSVNEYLVYANSLKIDAISIGPRGGVNVNVKKLKKSWKVH